MGKGQKLRKLNKERPVRKCTSCKQRLVWDVATGHYVDEKGISVCTAKNDGGRWYSTGEHTF